MFKIRCHCQKGNKIVTRDGRTPYKTYEEASLQRAIWQKIFPSIRMTIEPVEIAPEADDSPPPACLVELSLFDNGRPHARFEHDTDQLPSRATSNAQVPAY